VGFGGGLGRNPQLPEAIGILGVKPPVAGGWGSEGQSLQLQEVTESEGGAPSAGRFLQFFNKNNTFL